MTRQSLDAFRRKVTVEWPAQQQAGGKALLLRVAREGHAKIMSDASQQGIVPEYIAYANHPGNTNLESVTLPGPIVYRYFYLRTVTKMALDLLRQESPVQSGDYVRGHTIYFNGEAVDELPVNVSPQDEIFISNPVPYARRIEVGVTESGRSFVIQAAPHIYEYVATSINRRVASAKVSFGYVTLPNAYKVKGGIGGTLSPSYYGSVGRGLRSAHEVRRNRQQRDVGKDLRAPAVFIKAIV